MGIIQILAAIIVLVAAVAIFVIAKRGLQSRKGVDSEGHQIMYPLTRGHIVRYIAMVMACCLFIGDIGVSASMLIRSLRNGNGAGQENEYLAVQETPTPEPTATPEIEVAVETAAHEAISLTQDELDLLTLGHAKYLSRNSMPSNSRFRKQLAGGDFSGAVSFTLKMAVDGAWFDEMHGISLTNPDAKAKEPEEIEKLLKSKIKEWTKEYEDLPADELHSQLVWRIKDEILRNPIFGDMVNQFMSGNEYFTRNNDWVIAFRDYLDSAYKEPNSILSVCEFEDGWNSKMLGASAHIVVCQDYWVFAQKTCAILDDVVVLGICENMLPTESWYIPSDSVEADFVRTVKQEVEKGSAKERSVLLLAFKDKYSNVAVLFGFNTEDSRLEVFKPETPVTIQETPEPTNAPDPDPTPTPDPESKTYEATRKCVDEQGNLLRSDSLGKHKDGTVLKASQIGAPDIPGYAYKSGLADLKVTAGGDNVITLVYTKDPGPTPDPTSYEATRKCVDESGNQLRLDSLGKHPDGTTLTASQIGKPDIPGYTYKSGLGSLTVKANGNNTITLVYTKDPDPTPTPDPTYDVNRICVDEAGKQLQSDGLGSFKAGTVLNKQQIGQPNIPGYTFKSGPNSYTVVAGTNTVTLVYSKNPDPTPTPDPTYGATRKCVDEAGNQLRSDSLGSHKAGTKLTASQIGKPDIPGYTYKSGLTDLTISANGNNVVTLVYSKNPDPTPTPDPTYGATRKCVDEAGNELRSDGLGSHKAGTVLTANQIGKPDIPGYTYKSGLADLTISANGGNVITLVYSKNSGDGNGDKTPTAGTAQNGEANKGGGDSAAGNGGSDDGSFQDYDAAKAEADRLAAEAAAAEQRRLEEEAELRRQEELRKQQEAEAAKREQENADNQGQGSDLTTEGGEDPELPDKEVPAPSTDWTETTENPDGSSTSTTTNASTGTQTVETTTQDGNGNSTTSSSTSQTDPSGDTEGDIDEPPTDD